ncbi:hypothetical protein H5410_051143 [Solanum commersonii]|uniref:Craniofacial development protein 2-like n=1 Tax=Solanum commersonii TaxID=4109 RepID=A0A9J5WZM5_SOLCO|nr:hypothetical protein H5410_051143 [Solanum commersonii]
MNSGKEIFVQMTRESLIAISYPEPDKDVSVLSAPENVIKAVNGEKYDNYSQIGILILDTITEKIVIGGDFNGHIGATSNGFDDVHGGFGFGERNGGGSSLLEFAKAFELVIANSCFPKKENHLVTFRSSVAKTQIDYLLLRKGDRGLVKDCKVIPSEDCTTQHKLLVMDLVIKRDRRKKIVADRPRIKWGGLTPTSGELGEKLSGMGAWSGSGTLGHHVE